MGEYKWSNLKYCTDNSGRHFSKYVPSNKPKFWSGEGSPDNKTTLDLSDDAAHCLWGGRWRTPTQSELKELIDKCSWSWTGRGYKVTGPSGLSIFLPGQCGWYMSSSLNTDYPLDSWFLYFESGRYEMSFYYRYYRHLVRPVKD